MFIVSDGNPFMRILKLFYAMFIVSDGNPVMRILKLFYAMFIVSDGNPVRRILKLLCASLYLLMVKLTVLFQVYSAANAQIPEIKEINDFDNVSITMKV